MLKVILLIVLYNTGTGEVQHYVSPIPAFKTIAECEATRATLESTPIGISVWSKCIVPSDRAI